jgi:hypothetical protein
MEDYECERCGGVFNTKRHLVQHLKKRVKCMTINSERGTNEIIESLDKKEGLECEGCNRAYKNLNCLRVHKYKCKALVENVKDELEKRIDELQKELRGVINNKETVNQVANSITNNNDNRRIKTIDNSTTNNITVVINDIDSLEGIDYILKDPKFVEKILNWVTDKKGLLKYMDDRYYNPKRPENRGIRKLDNENIELRMRGNWRKCDNITALGAIIESMRIDWDSMIGKIKDDYSEEYGSNKKEMVVFKREVSDPLEMELDITDDEEERNYGKEMVYIEDKHMYKDEELVKKEKVWKNRIMKSVK